MTGFQFTGYDRDDRSQTGRIEAMSRPAAVQLLARRGLTVTALSEIRPGAHTTLLRRFGSHRRLASQTFHLRTTETLLADWARLTEAGLGIDEAAAITIQMYKDRPAGRLASRVLDDLKSGALLSKSLPAHVPRLPAVIAAELDGSERGGHLPDALASIAARTRSTRAFANDLRTALIYPTFVLLVAATVIVLLLVYVIPSLRGVVGDRLDGLPVTAQIVFGSSELVLANGPLILAVVLAMGGLGWLALRHARVRPLIDRMMLRLPVIGGVIECYEAARFCQALSSQLAGGVELRKALDLSARALGNQALRARAEPAADAVASGSRLSDALALVFQKVVELPSFVRIGERSGDLPGVLRHAAQLYEERARQQFRQAGAVITPVTTLIIGIVVGTIVLSLVGALASVQESALQ